MTRPIRRVAVLGAGVMGSGIAAHCANAGLPVLLLDIVPPKLADAANQPKAARDGFAAGALAKLKKARPAAFTHVRNAELVTIGNFDDDLAKVADCDLIVEAIIERLDIKRALFEKLDAMLSGETIIASNTSGLPLADLVEGLAARPGTRARTVSKYLSCTSASPSAVAISSAWPWTRRAMLVRPSAPW